MDHYKYFALKAVTQWEKSRKWLANSDLIIIFFKLCMEMYIKNLLPRDASRIDLVSNRWPLNRNRIESWGAKRFLPLVVYIKTMTSNSRVYAVGDLQQERVMAERKKWSMEWFHEKDNHSANRKMIVSSQGGNTSNMLKHLSTLHRP